MSIFFVTMHLVLSIYANNVHTQSNLSVCLWGRFHRNTENNVINGQYLYQGVFNGSPYYTKEDWPSNLVPILYLWRDGDGQFVISPTPPDNTDPEVYAYCTNATSFPWQCDPSQWAVFEGKNFVLDPQVYAINGSCPEWDCDSITTNITHQGCDGPFDTQIARNAWSNQAGDRYFWFHDTWFQWFCSSDTQYKPFADNLTVFAESQMGWLDTSVGSVVSIRFLFPDPPAVYEINCIKQPTTSPSPSPTQQPSVEPSQPTSIPSTYPSGSPSIDPTTTPSASPSLLPTSRAPSAFPSNNPSAAPSYPLSQYPSNHPSLSPSNDPTSAPMIDSLPTSPQSRPMRMSLILWICAGLILTSLALIVFFLYILWKRKEERDTPKMAAQISETHQIVHISMSPKAAKRSQADVNELEITSLVKQRKQSGSTMASGRSETAEIVHISMRKQSGDNRLEIVDAQKQRKKSQLTISSDGSEGKAKEPKAPSHESEEQNNLLQEDEFIVMGDDEAATAQPKGTREAPETQNMTDDFVVMGDDEY